MQQHGLGLIHHDRFVSHMHMFTCLDFSASNFSHRMPNCCTVSGGVKSPGL